MKLYKPKDYKTDLLTSYDGKFIDTRDWGVFKVRKNGRVCLKVEDEIVRCTPLRSEVK